MKKLLFAFSISLSQLVYAGYLPLDVIFLNIGDKDFYNNPVYKKFLDRGSFGSCWSKVGAHMYGIGSITQTKLPNGITQDLAHRIWNGDSEAVNVARKIMHEKGNGAENPEGYHGLYIINPKGDKFSVMAVGANSDPKKGLSGVSKKLMNVYIDFDNPEVGSQTLEISLCKVSKPLNIGFGP